MVYLGDIEEYERIENLIKEFKEKIVNVSNEELSDRYEETSYKFKHIPVLSITESIMIIMKKELEVMEFEMKSRKLKKPSFIDLYKKKQLEARWYLELKEKIIEHLNKLEQDLEIMFKSLDYENINKNYDNIFLDIDSAMIEISFIEKMWEKYSYERIIKKIRHLRNLYDEYREKIDSIGNISRKDIFFRLKEIKEPINEAEIRDNLKWIWDKIDLGKSEYQKIYRTEASFFEYNQGLKINSKIYESQIEDFNLCLNYVISNNMFKAILVLNDFIAPYNYILEVPFNTFEKLCIRTMIQNIVKTMDKNSDIYYEPHKSAFE